MFLKNNDKQIFKIEQWQIEIYSETSSKECILSTFDEGLVFVACLASAFNPLLCGGTYFGTVSISSLRQSVVSPVESRGVSALKDTLESLEEKSVRFTKLLQSLL